MISQKNQSFAYYSIVECTLVVELFRTRNRRFETIVNNYNHLVSNQTIRQKIDYHHVQLVRSLFTTTLSR